MCVCSFTCVHRKGTGHYGWLGGRPRVQRLYVHARVHCGRSHTRIRLLFHEHIYGPKIVTAARHVGRRNILQALWYTAIDIWITGQCMCVASIQRRYMDYRAMYVGMLPACLLVPPNILGVNWSFHVPFNGVRGQR
jgi:hypothetical protein